MKTYKNLSRKRLKFLYSGKRNNFTMHENLFCMRRQTSKRQTNYLTSPSLLLGMFWQEIHTTVGKHV